MVHVLLLTFEQWCEFVQSSVLWVLEPTFDENAVIRLKRKVLCYVVHNDSFMKWAADS